MDAATAKQDLLLNIDKVIYWRHGVLEVDPQNEDNARALKQLLTIREDVCALKASDREFRRLAEIHTKAQLCGEWDQLGHAQAEYLRSYGVVLELALDPYSFVQDLILELSSAFQWSQLSVAAADRTTDADLREGQPINLPSGVPPVAARG